MKWDIDGIIKLINQLGFPIIVCGALFWSQQTSLQQQTAVLQEFKVAIQNNTEALKKLSYTVPNNGYIDK